MILEKIKQLEGERKATFMDKHAETYMEHIRLIIGLPGDDATKLKHIKDYLEISYNRGMTDGYSVFNKIDQWTREEATK